MAVLNIRIVINDEDEQHGFISDQALIMVENEATGVEIHIQHDHSQDHQLPLYMSQKTLEVLLSDFFNRTARRHYKNEIYRKGI